MSDKDINLDEVRQAIDDADAEAGAPEQIDVMSIASGDSTMADAPEQAQVFSSHEIFQHSAHIVNALLSCGHECQRVHHIIPSPLAAVSCL